MQITIDLTDGQFAELKRATAKTQEPGFTPVDWVREAVESALASHRLPRVAVGRNGARIPGGESEMVTHRVLFPERSSVS